MIRRTCIVCLGGKVVLKGAVNVAAFPMLAGDSSATWVRCAACNTSGYQVMYSSVFADGGKWLPGTPARIRI